MANKHMKQYSTPLTIRAMSSRPHWNTTLHSLGLVTKKKKTEYTNVGEEVEKLGHSCIDGGNTEWCKMVSDSPKI